MTAYKRTLHLLAPLEPLERARNTNLAHVSLRLVRLSVHNGDQSVDACNTVSLWSRRRIMAVITIQLIYYFI